jgi:hypothetical protein
MAIKPESFKWSKGDHSLIICEGCAKSHPSRDHGFTRVAQRSERKPRCELCGRTLKGPKSEYRRLR